MTEEEWLNSRNAKRILWKLWCEHQEEFVRLVPEIHRFLLHCCIKIKDLFHDEVQLEAVDATLKSLNGAPKEDLYLDYLSWSAEVAAFAVDQTINRDRCDELMDFIERHPDLRLLPPEAAWAKLKDAAYFVSRAIDYPGLMPGPYVERLLTSPFLCPELLRLHVKPALT
ncbi:MAG: hypothetical protein AAF830_14855 [Pseudomonadota bacterium]